MPFVPLWEGEREEALKSGRADLKWVLADNEVSEDGQATLFARGFCKLSTFVGLGKTRIEVEEFLKGDLRVDASESLARRVQAARLLTAWDSAKWHVSEEESAKAEAQASQVDRPAPTMDHSFLRSSFEKIHGRPLLDETPSKQYVVLKMVDIEKNEPRAERLSEVSAVSDQQEDFLTATLDADGAGKIKKGAKDSSRPRNPMQLRAKLRLMGNMWSFLFLRFQKAWLEGIDPEVFRKYADFLLGSQVYTMPMPEESSYQLPWDVALTFELEIRRDACRHVLKDGIFLKEALEEWYKDTYLLDARSGVPATLAAAAMVQSVSSSSGAKRERSPDHSSPKKPKGEKEAKKQRSRNNSKRWENKAVLNTGAQPTEAEIQPAQYLFSLQQQRGDMHVLKWHAPGVPVLS
eukprot:11222732-Karenia_brevis.AAC.1